MEVYKKQIRLQCTFMHGCHCVELLEELVDTQAAEITRLRDALQEVSRTLGPYTHDPHEFAVGVIEDMQDIALNALVDNWADLKEQDND